MTQTIERLELSGETYRALERIAQVDGNPVYVVFNRIIKQAMTKQLRSLRREYQRLMGKELIRNLSMEEKAQAHKPPSRNLKKGACFLQERNLDFKIVLQSPSLL